jgi:hypothetical protein
MDNRLPVERIRRKFQALAPVLDERARRQWAAAEALDLPWGGVTAVAAATGLSRTTITAGLRELDDPGAAPAPPRRRPGGSGGPAAGGSWWRRRTPAWPTPSRP